mmetsp:Transcript_15331/g.30776  ORF Transcript_15331/g.30776 Transcript_15331/m.30776 type:complete len:241 (-) Transcript_15331:129-851(-)
MALPAAMTGIQGALISGFQSFSAPSTALATASCTTLVPSASITSSSFCSSDSITRRATSAPIASISSIALVASIFSSISSLSTFSIAISIASMTIIWPSAVVSAISDSSASAITAAATASARATAAAFSASSAATSACASSMAEAATVCAIASMSSVACTSATTSLSTLATTSCASPATSSVPGTLTPIAARSTRDASVCLSHCDSADCTSALLTLRLVASSGGCAASVSGDVDAFGTCV